MNVRKFIEKWRARRLESRMRAESARVSDYFRIAERAGKIYVLCDGTAVIEVPSTYNAETIAVSVRRCREAAVGYSLAGMKGEAS